MIRVSVFVLAALAMSAWSDTASAQFAHRGGGTVISVGFGNTGFNHWGGFGHPGWGPGWGYAYPVARPIYHPGFYGGYYGGGFYRPPVYGVPRGYYRPGCW